jgi:hypothetical protein
MLDRDHSTADVEERIAERIMSYLMRHPESKDTLEGIAEWWLEKQRIEETVDAVSRGLSVLCTEGRILREEYPGRPTFYVINRDADPSNDDREGSA